MANLVTLRKALFDREYDARIRDCDYLNKEEDEIRAHLLKEFENDSFDYKLVDIQIYFCMPPELSDSEIEEYEIPTSTIIFTAKRFAWSIGELYQLPSLLTLPTFKVIPRVLPKETSGRRETLGFSFFMEQKFYEKIRRDKLSGLKFEDCLEKAIEISDGLRIAYNQYPLFPLLKKIRVCKNIQYTRELGEIQVYDIEGEAFSEEDFKELEKCIINA